MADLQGTIVAAGIVPTSSEDTYPTHDSKYGAGGWREVATVSERNNIPRDRMREGMVVYVVATTKNYQLSTKGQTAAGDEWTELRGGGSVFLTQAQYDALESKEPSTFYAVTNAAGSLRKIYLGSILIARSDTSHNNAFTYTFPIVFQN